MKPCFHFCLPYKICQKTRPVLQARKYIVNILILILLLSMFLLGGGLKRTGEQTA